MRKKFAAMLAGSSILALASPAIAQPSNNAVATADASAEDEASEDEGDDAIVVTGTFIRGIAPAGANTLGLSREDVAATGATSTNEVLTTIPQVANLFNTADATATSIAITGGVGVGTNFQNQVTRPTLRNLTPNTSSGASTLVLMDGHRIVSAGINQAAPDADIIPPGALNRVEVVTDGGSSLYGADAVGGVINFITRDNYDGVGVTANYGFADDYETYSGSIIGGTDWGSGSVFATYSHQHRTEILGSERDWARGLDWSFNPPVPFSTACAVPTVYITNGPTTTTYAVAPDGESLLGPGTANRCDLTDTNAIIPEEERNIFMIGAEQEIASFAQLSIRAYHSTRETGGSNGPIGNSATNSITVPNTNPYFAQYQQGAETQHSVRLNWAPIPGAIATQLTHMESWGVTPELDLELGADWHLNLMTNYGRSETYTRNRQLNNTALNAARTATTLADALNPYDLAETPADVLNEILNTGNIWNYANGRHRMVNHRAVFDGPLMTLPGGQIRAAVGYEYLEEQFKTRAGSIPTGGEDTLTARTYTRDVNAFFGELNVPIVGASNRVPGIESLSLSLSARHDEYSDFGSTTNPRVAITYEPTDWLLFRANWGESFNAPTVVDQGNSTARPSASVFPFLFPVPPGGAAPALGQTMIFIGALPAVSVPGLEPQEATTWSLGFDVAPPVIPGLRGSLTYYNIEYRGELSQPPFFSPGNMATFPQFIDYNIDESDIADLIAGTYSIGGYAVGPVNSTAALDPLVGNASTVYAIVDARRRNLQDARHEGIDFSLNYTHDTSFGSIDAGISGNYRLTYAISTGGAFTDIDLDTNAASAGPRFRYRANVGATWGDLYARATYTYTGGMQVVPAADVYNQTEIDSFGVVDLFFRYNVGDLGVAEDVSVSLNINNVFDEDPPIWRQNGGSGITNGSTLGRLFMVGLNTRF